MTGFIMDRIARLEKDKSIKNIYAIIASSGSERVAAEFLRDGETVSWTYADYDRMARAYAAHLRRAFWQAEGGVVGIKADTCPEWPALFWGVMMAGFSPLLLNFMLDEEMTAYLLEQAGAVGIVNNTPQTLPDKYRQVILADLLAAPEAPANFTPRFGDSVSLCTSGTTATSRIFVYDAEALANQVLNSGLIYKATRYIINDEPLRALAFLPFHHVFGFMVNALWCSFIGYTHIFLKDRSPQTIVETCNKLRVHLVVAVPLLVNNLSVALSKKVAKEPRARRTAFAVMKWLSLAAQTVAPHTGLRFARNGLFKDVVKQLLGPDIRCIILGGSHTPSEHLRTISALGYYTVCGFGMTETAITSVETTMSLRKRISGSVGTPFTSAEYHVLPISRWSHGRGEMLVRGATLHSGRLIGGALAPPDVDERGWYPTGDIVRLKRNGMWVEGRSKDVIINESGENVYPDELEDTFSNIEGVEQFCALGTAREGDRRGKYQDITLVCNVGAAYNDLRYLETLIRGIAQANGRLPIYKKVNRVIVTPEKLPLVNGIKVKRIALREQIEERKIAYRDLDLKAGAVRAPGAAPAEPVVTQEAAPVDLQLDEIHTRVRGVFAEVLEAEPGAIADAAHFVDDLGGDSLQSLGIALKVEEIFGILIPVEQYTQCTSVADLSALVYAHMRGDVPYASESAQRPAGEVAPIVRFEDSPEYRAFEARKAGLAEFGNPYFVCHESPLSDVSLMDGRQVLNFGSYNYAGMSGRREVMDAAQAAIEKYGTSASGSRLLAGEKALHQELEREIADWKHSEAALVLVGGHSTNVTFVGNFCGPRDLIVYDALAHNSVEQGCRLSPATAKPFPHNDHQALEGILRTQRARFEKVLIIVEGAYSMDGDIAPIPEFVKLKKEYGCFLLVDEAHSAAVIGKTGGGVDEYFSLAPEDIDIRMGTLSKGLGTCGGYLAGSAALIEYLRYALPGFVFSVGISPPLAAATLQAIRLLRADSSIMERLQRNIRAFMQEAAKRGLDTCLAGESAIVPILVGRDEDAFALSTLLRQSGVFVPPAVYPAVPKNKARLRFCVISEHKPEQIIQALDTLERVAEEAGIELPRRDGNCELQATSYKLQEER
ncbi:MAG: aminotransferase class I/II-fold pyridoxal phosphate-dependent enzyme [Clostridia bacterium]|nr:aminotransferase class I/II-fold pyridoxal phosphate-dependent enzyme [Clostridia bacterium]